MKDYLLTKCPLNVKILNSYVYYQNIQLFMLHYEISRTVCKSKLIKQVYVPGQCLTLKQSFFLKREITLGLLKVSGYIPDRND